MKRPGLVAGGLILGTLVGAYFLKAENFVPGLSGLLAVDSQAETSHPEGANHEHPEKSAGAPTVERGIVEEPENEKLAMAAEQIDRSKIAVKIAERVS